VERVLPLPVPRVIVCELPQVRRACGPLNRRTCRVVPGYASRAPQSCVTRCTEAAFARLQLLSTLCAHAAYYARLVDPRSNAGQGRGCNAEWNCYSTPYGTDAKFDTETVYLVPEGHRSNAALLFSIISAGVLHACQP